MDRASLKETSRLVVKLGTGILTSRGKQIDPGQVEQLVEQVAAQRAAGREVVVVSSGAVGAGMGVLAMDKRPTDLSDLQACAAVGQSRLMSTYSELFARHELPVAQVLLTHDDLEHRDRHLNARNTLVSLLDKGVVPIVNENDAVSYTELKFGDREIDYDSVDQCQAVMEEFTSRYARTDETHDEALFAEVPAERQRSARGIEVGQIFYFGTKYSEPMGATVQGPDGKPVPVHMGSHGIGVSRLLGAIIEASHDDKGIIWPEGVTPFHVGIVNLKQGDEQADAACDALYASLQALGLDPLYDDTKERAGGKFATMDLIGLPWRITVGPRGLKNGVVELTSRRSGESEEMTPEAAIEKIAGIYRGIA